MLEAKSTHPGSCENSRKKFDPHSFPLTFLGVIHAILKIMNINNYRRLLPALAVCLLPAGLLAKDAPTLNTNITESEVREAQEAWGAALIQIATDYKEGGIEKATSTATAVLDGAYGYKLGPVLFKPTLTVAPQTFRPTKEGALSYFVGSNPEFANDSGFALKGWTGFEYENSAVHISGDLALTTGKVRLTNEAGEVTEVDKTWGFKKTDDGTIRIVLHHSSLPVTK